MYCLFILSKKVANPPPFIKIMQWLVMHVLPLNSLPHNKVVSAIMTHIWSSMFYNILCSLFKLIFNYFLPQICTIFIWTGRFSWKTKEEERRKWKGTQLGDV